MEERERKLNEQARALAKSLGASLPDGIGFALWVYEYGEKGYLAYIGSGDRSDMVEVVKEFLVRQGAEVMVDCPTCDGQGRIFRTPCPACVGGRRRAKVRGK